MTKTEDGRVDVRYGLGCEDFTEEQLKVFKEAIFKSKGKANSRFGAELTLAGLSSSEIAEHASKIVENVFIHKSPQHKMTKVEKAERQVLASVPNYWDTIEGRVMKKKYPEMLDKMGFDVTKELPITVLDDDASKYYVRRYYNLSGTFSIPIHSADMCRNDSIIRNLTTVKIFNPIVNVDFKSVNSRAGSSWLRHLSGATALPKDNVIPHYKKYREWEIDSLAHLDKKVAQEITPYELFVDLVNSAHAYNITNHPTTTHAIEMACVIEGFYAVSKEMGIVGLLDISVGGRFYCSQATTTGIMKNIIKMGGTYRRLVKSGFSESVARETVLAEINENIEKRATRPSVRFYPRNDYKDTPVEERQKDKKVSSPRVTRKKVLTAEDLAKIAKKKEEEV